MILVERLQTEYYNCLLKVNNWKDQNHPPSENQLI